MTRVMINNEFSKLMAYHRQLFCAQMDLLLFLNKTFNVMGTQNELSQRDPKDMFKEMDMKIINILSYLKLWFCFSFQNCC